MSLTEIPTQTQFEAIPPTEIFKFKEIYSKDAAINEATKLKEEAFGKLDMLKNRTTKFIKSFVNKNTSQENDDIDISYEGCFLKSYWKIMAERHTEYEYNREEKITISNTDAKNISIIRDDSMQLASYSVDNGNITLKFTESCVRENILSQIFDNENGLTDENFHNHFINKFKPKKYDFALDNDKLIKPALSKVDMVQKINTRLLAEIKSHRIISDTIRYRKFELYLVPIHIFKCYKKSTQETVYMRINAVNGERLENEQNIELLSNEKFKEVIIDIAAEAASSFIPGSGVLIKLAK
ncbi:hypothetical protein EIM44_10715 [Bibersteinia trehalosi]|nr:hypothetical protein [Bibersteinia trehalosi]RRN00341.1 hypothetical protein EIM44_10715 [Bibersteinia trehalosi]